MSMDSTFNRRALLKMGGAALASAALTRGQAPAEAAQGTISPAGTTAFRSRWVPEGAVARVAFVADHHYWPRHLENWGGGAQITTSTDRRMPDLAETLNAAAPDVSIHAGDVISAGGSFFPTPKEYAAQLAFQADFLRRLAHPSIPLVGNHETLDAHYGSHDQLGDWTRHFGAPFRGHDLPGWRLLTFNSMLPNAGGRHGKGDGYGNVYGVDDEQLDWLRAGLEEATAARRHVVLFTHIPPANWGDPARFESLLASFPCVKALVCGHWHRNNLSLLAQVPVLVRASNVETPFAYHLLHLYPEGRLVVVQHSQHFPHDEFISASAAPGKQGSEAERYLTIGGGSRLPLDGLTVVGDDARAEVSDGRLALGSRSGRATLLIDARLLGDARLSVSLVKGPGEAVGAVARCDDAGRGGTEAVITSRYSPSGKVFLRQDAPAGASIVDRSWFNIGDDLAYRLTLEVRGGRVKAAWKNMLSLEGPIGAGAGRFGVFVERGVMYVTDLVLESLT